MLLVVNFLTISKSLYRYFYWKLRHWTHVVESLTDKVQRDVMKEEIEKSWIIEDGRFTPKTKISSRELFVLLPTLHRTHFPTSVIEDMSSANNIIRINGIDCEKKTYLYRLTALSKRQSKGVQFPWKEIQFVLIIQKITWNIIGDNNKKEWRSRCCSFSSNVWLTIHK